MPRNTRSNGFGFIADGRPGHRESLRSIEMTATPNFRSVQELASHLALRLKGDGSLLIRNLASIGSAKEGDLVFAADESKLKLALDSPASAIVAGDFAQSS